MFGTADAAAPPAGGPLLAGSTLKDPVSVVTFGTFRLSAGSARTVADEVQDELHLLGEAQRFDLNASAPAVSWTFVGLNRNLEKHLESSRRFTLEERKNRKAPERLLLLNLQTVSHLWEPSKAVRKRAN